LVVASVSSLQAVAACLNSMPSLAMTAGYLYIAQDPSTPSQLKVGFTTCPPAQRERGLRGCADTDFEILRAYPTEAARDAETLAHAWLDELNLRARAGSRREQFVGDISQISEVCARAAAAKAAIRLPKKVVKEAVTLTHKDPFWANLLAMPVEVTGERITLGTLMGRALTGGAAIGTLERRFGIACTGFSEDNPQFTVDWSKTESVLKWQLQSGFLAPATAESKTKFKAIWRETCT
jgi:hypothetical protein